MIRLKEVSKTYTLGGESWMFGPVDIQIPAGKRVAILGSSGSGKSTFLHLLGALDLPDKGEINVFGKNILKITEREKNEYRKSTTGFVFQDFHLFPELTAEKNIEIALQINKYPKAKRTEKINSLLDEVQMYTYKNHLPKELSGGQRQRIAIARALANTPPLLLADEPTGNLDEKTGKKILDLLLNITKKENITMLCVTHDHHIADRFDAIINIENGKIISHTLS